MTYAEKLKDPRWQKMRLKVLERDEFECSLCKSAENTLHVHHRYYEKGKCPWEYPEDSLQTLCSECHEQTEKALGKLKRAAGHLDFYDVDTLSYFASAMENESDASDMLGSALRSLMMMIINVNSGEKMFAYREYASVVFTCGELLNE